MGTVPLSIGLFAVYILFLATGAAISSSFYRFLFRHVKPRRSHNMWMAGHAGLAVACGISALFLTSLKRRGTHHGANDMVVLFMLLPASGFLMSAGWGGWAFSWTLVLTFSYGVIENHFHPESALDPFPFVGVCFSVFLVTLIGHFVGMNARRLNA